MTQTLEPVTGPAGPGIGAGTGTGTGRAAPPRASATPERLAALAARVSIAAGEARERRTTRSALDGEPLGEVPVCTPDDVAAAFARARAAQERWALLPVGDRVKPFLRLHDLVLARQAEVLDLVQLESGKARKHAFEEVADTAIVSRYYARTAARHLRPRRRAGAIAGLTSARELHHPKGVVGIIAPWNYPLSLAITDAIPALIAGNGVVVKPDSQTPFTALWCLELLLEAGLPQDLLAVVTGSGSALGTPLIEAADYVCFTGSTATGRVVARQAGERLIGCSLELGGKNAMLVLHDADLDRAVEGAVRACFASAGQLCISIERLMVHESVAPEFTRRFVDRVRGLRLGAGLDWSADMGSLVGEGQLRTVTEHVADAVAKGATVLAGGSARPDLGPWFHEPTVLTGVTPEMTLCTEETFGPVVTVSTFADEEKAVRRANDSAYGLNTSVWTRDTDRGRRLAARIAAGTANVNEAYAAAWGSVDAPMGGVRDSGLGRRHGHEGIVKYTEAQTVATQRLLPLDAPAGIAPQTYARALTAGLRVLRRTPFVK